MKKTLCAVPWLQLSTKPNGNLRLCCLMTNSDDPDKGALRRGDGSIYNARDKDFSESCNAKKAKDLRKDLINGIQNPLCKTCWDKEAIGLKSKRQMTNRIFKETFTESWVEETTGDDGFINEYKPGYLDLRFGNLCNLKCIMCHPASSSKWYTDYAELTGKDHFHDTGEKIPLKKQSKVWSLENPDHFNWYESESFWHQLNEYLPITKQVYLVGGEPLLIEQHLSFLKKCVELGFANDIVLEYDTNLTVIKNEILDIWKNFKKIKLRVSIESVGKKNDYIRYPSRWDEIEKNIKWVQSSLPNLELDFSITWQIYNLFSITDIWERFPGIGTVRTLSSPKFLDVKILPRELKEKAITHLKNFNAQNERIDSQIQSLMNYLNNHMEFVDRKGLADLKKFTSNCDRLRGTNAIKVFPEIKSVLI